jgi:hypothetical protein
MRRGTLLTAAVATTLALLGLHRAPKLEDGYRQLLASWSDPEKLPALPTDPRVHFEPAARDCAEAVAKLLPAAMARIESAQLRPFAHALIVGVYASFDHYARANGFGDVGIAATARDGRVLLSPTLCGDERERLAGVLTHELSHTHLFGWRNAAHGAPPPSWFAEGLAVMVSDGGAAEQTSAEAALRALRQGVAIVVADDVVWRNFASIAFEKEPSSKLAPEDALARRQGLAFREAATFVAWLRSSDAKAFAALLAAVEDGGDFGAAFRTAYGAGAATKWREYRDGLREE